MSKNLLNLPNATQRYAPDQCLNSLPPYLALFLSSTNHTTPFKQKPKHVNFRILPPDRLRRPLFPLLRDRFGAFKLRRHGCVSVIDRPLSVEAHKVCERAVQALETEVDGDVVDPGEEALGIPFL